LPDGLRKIVVWDIAGYYVRGGRYTMHAFGIWRCSSTMLEPTGKMKIAQQLFKTGTLKTRQPPDHY
jgi:hypothetical protein